MSKTKKFVAEKGYYEILEVSPTATTLDIQRAFENLCNQYVDIETLDNEKRKKSAETLFTLTKAYEILTDPFQRLGYDERRFGAKAPLNNEVETIFREGLRYFKSNDIESAIRFFKEAVYLFPHKTLYRVHLGIAYFEKGWKEYTEKELRMALKLDPQNDFAQEVLARLMFKLSDRGKSNFFASKANQQLIIASVGISLLIGVSIWGYPHLKSLLGKSFGGNKQELLQIASRIKESFPLDLKESLNRKKSSSSKTIIPKLDPNFIPEGTIKDFTTKIPSKKFYYGGGNVMIEFDDLSVKSYNAKDLIGWKIDPKIGIAVVITNTNEVIAVSNSLPVVLADGREVQPSDPKFPALEFPEYEVFPKEFETKVAPPEPNKNPTVQQMPVQPMQVPTQATRTPSVSEDPEDRIEPPKVSNEQNQVGPKPPEAGMTNNAPPKPPAIGKENSGE